MVGLPTAAAADLLLVLTPPASAAAAAASPAAPVVAGSALALLTCVITLGSVTDSRSLGLEAPAAPPAAAAPLPASIADWVRKCEGRGAWGYYTSVMGVRE